MLFAFVGVLRPSGQGWGDLLKGRTLFHLAAVAFRARLTKGIVSVSLPEHRHVVDAQRLLHLIVPAAQGPRWPVHDQGPLMSALPFDYHGQALFAMG